MNAPTKTQRLAEWIQKQDPYICCLQEIRLKTRDRYRLKLKGWKKIFHANRNKKNAGVAILISDKIDFKTKAVKRDKEGQYIIIKGSIQEEDITIRNIYAPNIGALQYVRQMLTNMKGEINNNTVIESASNVGDPGLIPGLGRSPGEGNGYPLQYSGLENPRDGGAWWAAVYGVAQRQTRLKRLSSSSSKTW